MERLANFLAMHRFTYCAKTYPNFFDFFGYRGHLAIPRFCHRGYCGYSGIQSNRALNGNHREIGHYLKFYLWPHLHYTSVIKENFTI